VKKMPAVASAILVESPVYVKTSTPGPAATEAIRDLVHELRQPLSSIEAIAYYLEMTLPPEQLHARQQLLRMQELVRRTEVILEDAASTVRKPISSAASAS
jgi:nitrogen-specific signal transduction histidine kinase